MANKVGISTGKGFVSDVPNADKASTLVGKVLFTGNLNCDGTNDKTTTVSFSLNPNSIYSVKVGSKEGSSPITIPLAKASTWSTGGELAIITPLAVSPLTLYYITITISNGTLTLAPALDIGTKEKHTVTLRELVEYQVINEEV
ncbi:MAG: hypothetical protein ACI4MS_01680 [Candidatus Coproplasma sp.]